jgi:hypothetical protein
MFTKKSYTQIVCALVVLLSLTLASLSLAQEAIWATKSPMPTPRMVCCAAEVDGIIYVTSSTT